MMRLRWLQRARNVVQQRSIIPFATAHYQLHAIQISYVYSLRVWMKMYKLESGEWQLVSMHRRGTKSEFYKRTNKKAKNPTEIKASAFAEPNDNIFSLPHIAIATGSRSADNVTLRNYYYFVTFPDGALAALNPGVFIKSFCLWSKRLWCAGSHFMIYERFGNVECMKNPQSFPPMSCFKFSARWMVAIRLPFVCVCV